MDLKEKMKILTVIHFIDYIPVKARERATHFMQQHEGRTSQNWLSRFSCEHSHLLSYWKVNILPLWVPGLSNLYFIFIVFIEFKLLVVKDVSLGIPKSDLLGVTMALIHVAAQQFLAVWNGLNHSSVTILEAISLTAVK